MRFVCVLLGVLATACGPTLFVVPGGELRGTVVSGPVDDWGFTDAVQRVQLETRPGAPYSIHIYGVSSGSAFYIASQGWRLSPRSGGDARWVGPLLGCTGSIRGDDVGSLHVRPQRRMLLVDGEELGLACSRAYDATRQ